MSDRRRPNLGSHRVRSGSGFLCAGFGFAVVTLLTAGTRALSAQARLSGTVQVSALVVDSQSVWGAVSGTNQAILGWRQGTPLAPQSPASPVQIALVAIPQDPGGAQFLLVTVEYLQN